MMRCLTVCVIVFSIPAFAVEYDVGVAGIAGFAVSRWTGDVYNFQGEFLTDHLDSQTPVYQAGLTLSIWLTERIGVRTGAEYGWYNYKYTFTAPTETVESEWKYRDLFVPIDLMYGIPLGRDRFIIGVGLSVCLQLSGTMPGSDDIPDSLLETTVGPQISLGYEIHAGRVRVFPSFRYIYGIDGISDRILSTGEDISKHYFLLGLGLYYSL